MSAKKATRHISRSQEPKDRIFIRVISDISVVLRETTLTIPDSIETVSSVEYEIVGSLCTTELIEITLFKKTDLQRPIP